MGIFEFLLILVSILVVGFLGLVMILGRYGALDSNKKKDKED